MKIVWNPSGFEQVLRGPIAQNLVHRQAMILAGAAGPGYEWDASQGKSRYHGMVYPGTWPARHDNATNNTLLRVLG